MVKTGTLFIVSTPIGNLDDITHRAIKVLNEVDLIAAEDTRHSQKLLQHWGVSTRMTAVHDHNEKQIADRLIEQLKNGLNVALISDAGTPLISDPGYNLVNRCREHQVPVVPIPGVCAAIAALSASGLPTDQFLFIGFLPVKQVAKHTLLERLNAETATTVFYESPRRIADTVKAIVEVLGEQRRISIGKEITKTFETFYAGTAAEVLAWLLEDANHQRGEFVLMVAGAPENDSELPPESLILLKTLMQELPLKKAAAITAQHYGLKKNALYQLGLTLND
ncbi:16S rRNA (cytidine(1402)-2'-O)-methyltransferase [Aliiglaciecola lipolytica]|uniref:Ribosomal RNA small subunit methyltransferase I n=1 Tax=Aliiglaciecola lipolytica E3 TaxID=1127673 RepID=K6XVB5_9ALTE|nr:16S rRNA (cytidine(1402)-2'-O)-methyltransferase [Aliiglaciecola lipolytica]GAC15621.1 16S rRNA (cytidine1402-2'-O)-methyltransferase [Aliiglaciecola lipolytica E3]